MIFGNIPLEVCIKNSLGIDVELHADGKFHRYPSPNKGTSNKACWVKLSKDGRSAVFGNFITGESHSWLADSSLDSEALIEGYTRYPVPNQFELDLQSRKLTQNKAAEIAISTLRNAISARPGSHYVSQKKISPKGLFQEGVTLLVPIQNILGEFRNIQRIYPDGSKFFLKGGEVKGNFALCGKLFSTGKLFICEGYATAATIHDITGECAAAAMNANNLMAVALKIATHAPAEIEIIIAADNDHKTKGNPGLTKATEAAQAIGAKIVNPEVPCSYPFCECTDFNDWEHCYNRREEV